MNRSDFFKSFVTWAVVTLFCFASWVGAYIKLGFEIGAEFGLSRGNLTIVGFTIITGISLGFLAYVWSCRPRKEVQSD